MAAGDSLGPMGPNILSVEPVSGTVYSVQGDTFAAEFRVEVLDGVGQAVQGVTLSDVTATSFTLTLPYATPGAFTLNLINPDGRTSSMHFSTPGTSASNDTLRVNS